MRGYEAPMNWILRGGTGCICHFQGATARRGCSSTSVETWGPRSQMAVQHGGTIEVVLSRCHFSVVFLLINESFVLTFVKIFFERESQSEQTLVSPADIIVLRLHWSSPKRIG